MTLHPASQNFLVAINDECANPGTMCASVITCGSYGMLRLHVWVDLIVFSFGSVIEMGFVATFLFTTGASSTKKWPVAPESDIACFTDLVTRFVSNIHALLLVGMMILVGHLVVFVGGL